MDGIDRYIQPNTLDGISIYEVDEALLVDGSNAMQADADMGGHNVKNVANATTADEAINLGQFTTGIAGKADITYVDAQDALRVLKAGDTMTGPLQLPGNPTLALQATPKQYCDLKATTTYVNTQDALRVLKAGDTMTGALVLPGNPTLALQATPKQYCDLKATTTYVDTQDALRVLKAGDTMSGNLAMDGFKVTGLAAATANGEAVRYEQLTTVDGNCVHKTGNESISGIKTFTTLPETTLTATTNSQFCNFGQVLVQTSYSDLGRISYWEVQNTPSLGFETSRECLACTIPFVLGALTTYTIPRYHLLGQMIKLTARTQYTNLVVRCRKAYLSGSNAFYAKITVGIYNRSGALVSSIAKRSLVQGGTLPTSNIQFNYSVPFDAVLTVNQTDNYIVAIHIDADSSSYEFTGSSTNNGEFASAGLAALGDPLRFYQKAWFYYTGTANWTIPASIYNLAVTPAASLWVAFAT